MTELSKHLDKLGGTKEEVRTFLLTLVIFYLTASNNQIVYIHQTIKEICKYLFLVVDRKDNVLGLFSPFKVEISLGFRKIVYIHLQLKKVNATHLMPLSW